MRWFGWFRKRPLDLTPYKGQWVAIDRNRVLFSSPTADGLLAEILKRDLFGQVLAEFVDDRRLEMQS